MALNFYNGVAEGFKLKVRKFYRLIPTFVEVTGEKLVGSLLSLILNRVKVELQGERLYSLQLFLSGDRHNGDYKRITNHTLNHTLALHN